MGLLSTVIDTGQAPHQENPNGWDLASKTTV